MRSTRYTQAKYELKQIADSVKKIAKNDKPLIRMVINDAYDSICKGENLTEYQKDLLCNYAIKLHPKD